MGTTGPDLQCEIDQFVAEAQSWWGSWLKMWTAPLQCLAALTGGAATTYRSPRFSVGPSDAPRTLVLSGDLVPYYQVANAPPLSKSVVRLVPASLDANQAEFHLEVAVADVGSCPAGVYHGTVMVGGAANVAGSNVPKDVWIVIP